MVMSTFCCFLVNYYLNMIYVGMGAFYFVLVNWSMLWAWVYSTLSNINWNMHTFYYLTRI